MYPTKRYDNVDRVMEHALRHARVHNQLASDDRYAGGIGWCAFDYNTHANFGSGDHICYHGVARHFPHPETGGLSSTARSAIPKRRWCWSRASNWSQGDQSGAGGIGRVPIVSNCDHLKIYCEGELKLELDPDRADLCAPDASAFHDGPGRFAAEPLGRSQDRGSTGRQTGQNAVLSGSGKDVDLKVIADDKELDGDGRDATRVVLMVTDEYGNMRPFTTAAVSLSLTGPGEIIGENPLVLAGGAAAVWVRAKEAAGTVRLTATNAILGSRSVTIRVKAAEPEMV